MMLRFTLPLLLLAMPVLAEPDQLRGPVQLESHDKDGENPCAPNIVHVPDADVSHVGNTSDALDTHNSGGDRLELRDSLIVDLEIERDAPNVSAGDVNPNVRVGTAFVDPQTGAVTFGPQGPPEREGPEAGNTCSSVKR